MAFNCVSFYFFFFVYCSQFLYFFLPWLIFFHFLIYLSMLFLQANSYKANVKKIPLRKSDRKTRKLHNHKLQYKPRIVLSTTKDFVNIYFIARFHPVILPFTQLRFFILFYIILFTLCSSILFFFFRFLPKFCYSSPWSVAKYVAFGEKESCTGSHLFDDFNRNFTNSF